ncbi:hypothetical protein TNCV_2955201 [Trichonephila clavipes]|nr:hypothetical protein TNCV_2955201 [Trichonephila clavipes]
MSTSSAWSPKQGFVEECPNILRYATERPDQHQRPFLNTAVQIMWTPDQEIARWYHQGVRLFPAMPSHSSRNMVEEPKKSGFEILPYPRFLIALQETFFLFPELKAKQCEFGYLTT